MSFSTRGDETDDLTPVSKCPAKTQQWDRNMFVGHYGVAFAAKPVGKHVPLWVWFIAVQWLDVIW